MNGMGEALTAVRNIGAKTAPLVIYYAFKQSAADLKEGVSSPGWGSFLQGVMDAGLGIDGTWPVRTELTGNLKNKLNVLASSIVLVCRKRNSTAKMITRADFARSLKHELPDAIDNIRQAGVGPVDMQQSVIGPGIGNLSRYAKVLENNDSAMPVRTALSLINRVWEEIENELDAAFDAEYPGSARVVCELRLRSTRVWRINYAHNCKKHLGPARARKSWPRRRAFRSRSSRLTCRSRTLPRSSSRCTSSWGTEAGSSSTSRLTRRRPS